MKTIHIYTQYYWPVSNAPANRIANYVKALKNDFDITIITGIPNYPTGIKPKKYKYKLFLKETGPYGEKIIRTYEFPTKNEGFLKRTLNYISYMLSSFFYGLFAKKPDLIIVTSPPLFSAIGVLWLNKIRKIPYIVDIRDLWPESVVALGLMKKESLSYKIFSWFENKIYKNAKYIIAVTKGIKQDIEKKGFKNVILQYNIIDINKLPKFSENELNKIKKQYKIPKNKKIFVYAGNHSPAQNLWNIIKLAQNYKNGEFYMLGDGESKQELENFSKKNNIQNIHFLGFKPKELVYKFINIANLCISSLEDNKLFYNAIPTKTLEYLAYGKAVIAFIKGDLAEKINQYQAGLVYDKYKDKIIENIKKFKHNEKNSKKLVKEYFSFDSFKKNILGLIKEKTL